MRAASCRGLFTAGLLLGAACSRGRTSSGRESASVPSPPPPDSPVYAPAENACLGGDTLLRRIPGTTWSRLPATPFDSLWHGPSDRWACRVAAIGKIPASYAPIDSLLTWLRARGWMDRTTISADGPDGTIQGVHRAGVTCLVEGRWDGGDDSDSTAARSDTMEVYLACTRLAVGDTLVPQ